jgi:Tfp pilus assembly protein PilV
MKNHQPAVVKRPRYSNAGGFTLVELLVASIILFIAILGIVGITRKGREIDTNDNNRRLARAIMMGRFESPQFQYAQYENLKLMSGNGTSNTTVTINDRSTPLDQTDDITGTLATTISAEQTTIAQGITVPYITVTMQMTWNELQGQQTITLAKQITQ